MPCVQPGATNRRRPGQQDEAIERYRLRSNQPGSRPWADPTQGLEDVEVVDGEPVATSLIPRAVRTGEVRNEIGDSLCPEARVTLFVTGFMPAPSKHRVRAQQPAGDGTITPANHRLISASYRAVMPAACER